MIVITTLPLLQKELYLSYSKPHRFIKYKVNLIFFMAEQSLHQKELLLCI